MAIGVQERRYEKKIRDFIWACKISDDIKRLISDGVILILNEVRKESFEAGRIKGGEEAERLVTSIFRNVSKNPKDRS